jgi:hypothetical protein
MQCMIMTSAHWVRSYRTTRGISKRKYSRSVSGCASFFAYQTDGTFGKLGKRMTREPAPGKSCTLWLEAIVDIHSGTELIMVRRLGARALV